MENEPAWQKAYSSTRKGYVDFSKWLNEQTGGSDHYQGWMDVSPGAVEHIFEGYLGGAFTFYDNSLKAVNTAMGRREFEWRNIPIARSFITGAGGEARFRNARSAYFDYKDEMNRIKDEVDSYRRDINKAEDDAARERAEERYLELLDRPVNRFLMEYWEPLEKEVQMARKEHDDEWEHEAVFKAVEAYRTFRKSNSSY